MLVQPWRRRPSTICRCRHSAGGFGCSPGATGGGRGGVTASPAQLSHSPSLTKLADAALVALLSPDACAQAAPCPRHRQHGKMLQKCCNQPSMQTDRREGQGHWSPGWGPRGQGRWGHMLVSPQEQTLPPASNKRDSQVCSKQFIVFFCQTNTLISGPQ